MGEYKPEIEDMACTLDKIHEGVEDINKHIDNKENSDMNDIAGLLALMQNNRGTDLPGMLALCRERGYDRSFGNEGGFMTIFLLLFLLGNGGWGGLNAANRAAFNECAGNSCQSIIGLHDRISAAQQASNQGFFQLDTKICESIANVISAVRNQGDRAVDSTHDLQTQVQTCCCQIERSLDAIGCEVRNVKAAVELAQERNINAMQAMEARLTTQAERNQAAVLAGQKDIMCKMSTMALEAENARLQRELCECKNNALASTTANAVVSQLQGFALNHWTPTKTTTTPAA